MSSAPRALPPLRPYAFAASRNIIAPSSGGRHFVRLFDLARSDLRDLDRASAAEGPCRRGPTPALSDAQLLAAIRNDLARSPFQGEGHRKVHARLRILDGVRVSRTRVLRVMRAQGLLSPHRGRQGEPKPHDGTIVTSAPDVMWGTDGARVLTVDDGWVWTFAAIDHWNAECVGWHVCKVGDRFAALEPVAQGLRRRSGSVEADAARGRGRRVATVRSRRRAFVSLRSAISQKNSGHQGPTFGHPGRAGGVSQDWLYIASLCLCQPDRRTPDFRDDSRPRCWGTVKMDL